MNASWDHKEDKLVPRNYFVPDFGKDQDIINTQGSLSRTENNLKQTMHADFDEKDGIKRNYFVPDFGVDHDIKTSLNNSKSWTPQKDGKGKFILPENSVEFKL